MAALPSEEKLNYLLSVLSKTELPQPDYHAVARVSGISNANAAYDILLLQKKHY